jgi:hypothetical protein
MRALRERGVQGLHSQKALFYVLTHRKGPVEIFSYKGMPVIHLRSEEEPFKLGAILC